MIQICYVVLTLATGQPTMVNFNDVAAIGEGYRTPFGVEENKIWFLNSSAFGAGSISIKESVEEVAEKVKQCTSPRVDIPFIYVIE